MKRITIIVAALLIGVVITLTVTASAEADEVIAEADAYIETVEPYEAEPETVSLSYAEWQEQKQVEEMDVWELGEYLWGICPNDTSRALKLITIEGYVDSPLSYYVACCCWVRATEGYWGYPNLYRAFGEADPNYDEWMDCIEVADWAYDYLRWCYLSPTYCRYCNGMVVPENWIYAEDTDCGTIFCW